MYSRPIVVVSDADFFRRPEESNHRVMNLALATHTIRIASARGVPPVIAFDTFPNTVQPRISRISAEEL